MKYRFFITLVFLIGIFYIPSILYAQEKGIGDPCIDSTECMKATYCSPITNTCEIDIGGPMEPESTEKGDLRKPIRSFAFNGLAVITGILVLISVGVAFLWRKVFRKASKAGIVKKVVTIVLIISVLLGWMSLISGWITILGVINRTSGVS